MLKHCFLLLSLTLLTACATSPLGRSQLQLFSDTDLSQMGLAAYDDIRKKEPRDNDPAANAYVRCVANAITAVLPSGGEAWEVTLFRDDSANAFALPGGKIGVNSGLLKVAGNPSQLATVIGHEVAHVLARHSGERLSNQAAVDTGLQAAQAISGGMTPAKQQLMGLLGVGAQVGVLLPFSRTQESEADLLGLDLMARAGFDPRQSVNLWQNMERASGGGPPAFLSTHPSPGGRIAALQNRIPQALELYQQAQASSRKPACRVP
ncbi:M48 family metallopeptidase [Immundisolibacter sp.]|uniref:M48 family metallopeptidase n=1 Tax=Immundisolibacter sp. TaxID=1934948 RepID=UPI00356261D5